MDIDKIIEVIEKLEPDDKKILFEQLPIYVGYEGCAATRCYDVEIISDNAIILTL